jgi:hypothetical protein
MAADKVMAKATPLPEHEDLEGAAELLAQGKALQRVGTPFVTAVSVQKARNLDKVVAAMDREAEYAGKTFWYSWRDKKGNLIEGPSIGLANSLARSWGNCAVTVDFQEFPDSFVITPRFIDIETGFQCERVFRQGKGQVQGNFDPERKLDMALQIGQSKAIRNVVCNAVPKWMVARAIQKAKDAVVKGIDPAKLTELKKEVAEFFKERGITLEQLVAKAKRPMAEWTTLTIATFQADMHAVESGEVDANDIFASREATPPPAGPLTGASVAAGLEKTTEKEPLVVPDKDAPEGPSAAEQEEIKRREIFDSKAMRCAKCPAYTFATDDADEMKKHMEAKHPAGAPAKGTGTPSKGSEKPKSGGLFS